MLLFGGNEVACIQAKTFVSLEAMKLEEITAERERERTKFAAREMQSVLCLESLF